jgi:hypothetical protein
LIFHSQDNISLATASETYSERALFNLVLFLFSIRYLTVFDNAKENINQTNNSIGKFKTKKVLRIITNGKISKNITIIAILLANKIYQERLRLKYTDNKINKNNKIYSRFLSKY